MRIQCLCVSRRPLLHDGRRLHCKWLHADAEMLDRPKAWFLEIDVYVNYSNDLLFAGSQAFWLVELFFHSSYPLDVRVDVSEDWS